MSRFARYIRPYVRAEISAANACATRSEFAASFRHLERAHVLGQASTRYNIWVHWRMLLWAIGQRQPREIAGQVFRIYCAAMVTVMGLVLKGDTGGSNVCPFQRMPVSEDLAAVLAKSPKSALVQFLAIFLFVAKSVVVATLALSAVPEKAGPDKAETVEIGNRHVAFRVIGSGRPAIVLISGLGDDMAVFDDIADELGKTNTVILL